MDFKQVFEYTQALKILYIEDNEALLTETSELLEDFFALVDTATNGQEGLVQYQAYFDQHQSYYDLIITDINMPIMDGHALIKAVKAINKEQSIMVISAYNESERLIELIQSGISDFLLKPIVPEQLMSMLHQSSKNIILHKNEKLYKEHLEQLNTSLDNKVTQQANELIDSQKKSIQAEAAKQAIAEFTANMSHELRTPMHGILSFASFGINKIDSLPKEKILRYFNNIKISGDRLLILLNDLLDLSKLEAGKMPLSFHSASIHSIAQSCIELQQAHLAKKEKQAIWLENSFQGKGVFDHLRIGQVITNLLSNAIKFGPPNSTIDFFAEEIMLDKAIQSAPEKPNNNQVIESFPAIKFSVRDYGNGFPDGEQNLIFNKYQQSSDKTTHSGGTGLGLPICYEIIKLHQGKIWAENHPEGGAVFSFIIPLTQS